MQGLVLLEYLQFRQEHEFQKINLNRSITKPIKLKVGCGGWGGSLTSPDQLLCSNIKKFKIVKELEQALETISCSKLVGCL